ncbi:MAG: TROVE domain-containing protein [Chloroflexota bacterium]
MAHKIYNLFNRKKNSQNQPIPGSAQVPNSAGGYAWKLDAWGQLMRFLVMGTEGGTYYIAESQLTRQNAQAALACLQADSRRFVDTVVDVSSRGRAYKNDPALFALALAAAAEDPAARRYALEALPQVVRIGTHLFHFAEYVNGLRGWGRSLRQAIARWYNDQPAEKLAFQLAKYQRRDSWSHRDLLRLAHPVPPTDEHASLYRWAAGKSVPIERLAGLVQCLERMRSATGENDVAALVREYQAPREVVPTEYLTSPRVWDALLPGLGLTALLRNLGNLGKCGLLLPGNRDAIDAVIVRLSGAEALRKARLHPIQVLAALITYRQGHGMRGRGTWPVVPQVVGVLNEAFSLAFENVVPTGKRLYLGLDVSGSMGMGWIGGVPGLSPRAASAALAMIAMQTEKSYVIKGFQDRMLPLALHPQMGLDDVVRAISDLPFGRTDCAQPMLDALQHNLAIDAFVVYTDSETWAGSIHPAQALWQYRQKTGIPAKLIVVGMTANKFTIADPGDAGMLDVVGFSTDTPAAVADFVADRLGTGAAEAVVDG